ncbi:MAG: tail fiber domain-containing protein [Patescibacteria group bacterium]|nr:tail fiber domain-containing protein [Patescibacteria group bacterium]
MPSFPFRKPFVYIAAIAVLSGVFTFGDDVAMLLMTPLPSYLRDCISRKIGNDALAQQACSAVTTNNSVAVWQVEGGNARIRNSRLTESYGVDTPGQSKGRLTIQNTEGIRFENSTAGSDSRYGFLSSVDNIHVYQNAYWDGTWKVIDGNRYNGNAAGFQTNLGDNEAFRVAADTTTRATNGSSVLNPLMVVKTNGRVGIGTISPSGMLDVAGDIELSGKMAFRGSDSYLRLNQDLEFANGVHTPGTFSIAGHTGIGSSLSVGTYSSLGKLHIEEIGDGLVFWRPGDNVSAIQSYIDGVWSGRASYAGGCCNTLSLQPDVGVVSIGTNAAPIAGRKLHVQGNASFTGALMLAHNSAFVEPNAGHATIQNYAGHLYLGPDSSSSQYIIFRQGLQDRIYYLLNGSINTYAPSFRTDGGYLVINPSAQNRNLYLNWDTGGTVSVNGGLAVFGNVTANGYSYFSDLRSKENISTIAKPLEKVAQLRGVEFDWKNNPEHEHNPLFQKHSMGFIAQEVEKVLPFLVTSDTKGFKSVSYANLTALLTEALKELFVRYEKFSAEVSASIVRLEERDKKLEEQVRKQQEIIRLQEERIKRLEQKVEALSNSHKSP